MHPADTDLAATCRRDDAIRAAATRRTLRLLADRSPLRARVGRRLVAWGERLQSTPARATTRAVA